MEHDDRRILLDGAGYRASLELGRFVITLFD